jgi:molybdenum cofactor guanylyltransferase
LIASGRDAHAMVSGLILAGGRGTRMGGIAKGLAPFAGKPMIEWVVTAIRPQVHTIRVSANRYREAYAGLGFPVLPDLRTETVGPLGGIERGLTECLTPWLLVVPCDSPVLPIHLTEHLLQAAQAENRTATYASCDGREHYTHLLVHQSLRMDLTQALDAGVRKVGAWLKTVGAGSVPFANGSIRNINSLDDLS